jgi:MFS family permease
VHVFPGWIVVAAAFAILFVAYGAQFSFGVMFSPLLAEFGWTRGDISGVFGVYTAVYCLCALAAGRLTDRLGPRPVVAVGGVLLGGALAAMSLVSQLWQIYVLYGLVAGIGMSTAFIPCSATVVRWFVRRRGFAVGLAASGGSAGVVMLPPLVQAAVSVAGWRVAFAVFGLSILGLVNLLAPLMRRDPESLGLRPDGAQAPAGDVARVEEGESWPLGRALRSPDFWLLGMMFNLTWFSIFIPTVHLTSLAQDRGLSPMVGAWAVSVLGLGALCGRLLIGGLSDRIGRKASVATAVIAQSLALASLAALGGLPPLLISAFVFGAAYAGTSTLFPVILGDFFGRGHVGSLSGFLFAFSGLPTGLGPFVTGALRDTYGHYGVGFGLAALVNAAALVLLPWARPPRGARERG